MEFKKGKKGFHQYYKSIYGEKRWESLSKGLLGNKKYVGLINPFVSEISEDKDQGSPILTRENNFFPPPSKIEGLYNYYLLDEASYLCAQYLEVRPHHRVLDMCSAPGGKALCLIYNQLDELNIVLNEKSAPRRARLKQVIADYVPQELHSSIQIQSYDARKWGLYEKSAYDRILLDAPCSSEKYVLNSSKELNNWSIKRTQRLAQDQWAMICAAIDALKPSGRLLYSTCSLSPYENEGQLEKIYKKRADQVTVIPIEGQSYKYFFPDDESGGPLFCCLLEKKGPGN